jgi:hypothetical protein
MEGGRSAREGDGVGHACDGGQLALKGVQVRTNRCNPVAVERVKEELSLRPRYMRRR